MAVIYGIKNLTTSFVYVGCTKNAAKRMREHRCLLRAGNHASAALQKDWSQCEEANFALEILETLPNDCPVALKRNRELWWMGHYDEEGLLYNENRLSFALSPEASAKGVEASRKSVGNRWTPEANRLRSIAQLGKPKGHGAKISATKKANRAKRQSDEIV